MTREQALALAAKLAAQREVEERGNDDGSAYGEVERKQDKDGDWIVTRDGDPIMAFMAIVQESPSNKQRWAVREADLTENDSWLWIDEETVFYCG